jgi:hypothetical protein
VLPDSFLAPPTTKRKQQLNPPKLITHPTQSHPSTPRERQGKKYPSRERKLSFVCFMVVLVTWMSFASGARKLRGSSLSMLGTHIVMSSLIFRLVPTLVFRLAFTLRPQENRFEPRRFGYGPCPRRGDRFLHRSGFAAGGSFPHLGPRHLDGPRFPHHGSHPTRPSGEVQRTMKPSSGCMVKCWIPKIYLTNPSTEP